MADKSDIGIVCQNITLYIIKYMCWWTPAFMYTGGIQLYTLIKRWIDYISFQTIDLINMYRMAFTITQI